MTRKRVPTFRPQVNTYHMLAYECASHIAAGPRPTFANPALRFWQRRAAWDLRGGTTPGQQRAETLCDSESRLIVSALWIQNGCSYIHPLVSVVLHSKRD